MQKEEKIVRGADLATTGQKIKSYVLEQIADKVSSDDIDNVVELTKAQYDALATKDARTMYIISDSAVDSDHVGIAKFEQTTKSTAPGGTNIWTVTLTNNQTFTLAVMNGTQGNSGYSGAAGELEVVNNVTQGGATAALSAEMGKQLEGEISQLGLEVDEVLDIRTSTEITYPAVTIYKTGYYIGNGTGNTEGAEVAYNGRAIGSSVGWKQGDTIRISYLKSGGTSSVAVGLYKNGEYIQNLLSGNSGVVINTQTDFTPSIDFDEVRFTLSTASTSNINLSKVSSVIYSERLDNMETSLRVLCFGNSFTQDSWNYVPWILKDIAPGVKLDIVMACIDACPMAQHCANITGVAQTLAGTTYNPGVNYNCYRYNDGDSAWGGVFTALAPALISEGWDIITFQQNGQGNYQNYDTYYKPFLGPTFKALEAAAPTPVQIGWLLTHGSYSYDVSTLRARWNLSAQSSQTIMSTLPVDILFPYGTAIQNLRTTTIAVGQGEGNLLADAAHLQEGISTLCASYSIVTTLLEVIGRKYKGIIGEKTRVTYQWITDHNCPGTNYKTAGVVEGITDDNCYLAQFAAIAAQKSPYTITEIS